MLTNIMHNFTVSLHAHNSQVRQHCERPMVVNRQPSTTLVIVDSCKASLTGSWDTTGSCHHASLCFNNAGSPTITTTMKRAKSATSSDVRAPAAAMSVDEVLLRAAKANRTPVTGKSADKLQTASLLSPLVAKYCRNPLVTQSAYYVWFVEYSQFSSFISFENYS